MQQFEPFDGVIARTEAESQPVLAGARPIPVPAPRTSS